MSLTRRKEGSRTLFLDGDEHVATILDKGGSWFTWYTKSKSGVTTLFDEAEKAVLSELE